ncbi:hypothetical protein V1477_016245 [Vespula maculifrons]|uniref:Uncharacterized protein n=2 Tax=Vespula TaxID=7451 RepID=A0A834K5R2_VESVU|nr:hypothetical protein HZH66_006746 [Vespula vulgaris]
MGCSKTVLLEIIRSLTRVLERGKGRGGERRGGREAARESGKGVDGLDLRGGGLGKQRGVPSPNADDNTLRFSALSAQDRSVESKRWLPTVVETVVQRFVQGG